VRVCVRASQLGTALNLLEPYLRDHPEDRGMQRVALALRDALEVPSEEVDEEGVRPKRRRSRRRRPARRGGRP
jgi:hypothetical protein